MGHRKYVFKHVCEEKLGGIILKKLSQQEEAVLSFLNGKDVFAVLPTGFGKSLIYQSFVFARDILDGQNVRLQLAWLFHFKASSKSSWQAMN